MVKKLSFNEDEHENFMKIMKKKEYIKPSAEVIEMETAQMLAASASDIPVGGDGNDGGEALSNRHRGEWGNLWK